MLLSLVSCLEDKGEDTEYIIPTDATISSFSIKGDLVFSDNGKRDTIKNGLNEIVFSIDQLNNRIFNRDSARYGMILPDSVIVKYTTAFIKDSVASTRFQIYNIIGKDSIPLRSGKDSISLSQPLTLRSFAAKGNWKDYTFQFNVHQTDPDAFWWKQVNSDLDISMAETKAVIFNDVFYCFARPITTLPCIDCVPPTIDLHISSDMAESWGNPITTNLPNNIILSQIQQFGEDLFACTFSGELYKANVDDNFTSWTQVSSEYPVRNVFGAVANTNILALAVEKDGLLVSATFNGAEWLYGNELPESFPKENFSSLSYIRTYTGFLTIAGGTARATWSTTDGLHWVQMNAPLPPNTQGANIFLYDDKFYLLNGNGNQSIYTSRDGANTWQIAPDKVNFPTGYTLRKGASVVVGKDNTIYIIGGEKNTGNPVNDIWKGRINKLNWL